MPKTDEATKQVGFVLHSHVHKGIKMDSVRWDCQVGQLVEALLVEYLAKSDSERERFVRSLQAS